MHLKATNCYSHVCSLQENPLATIKNTLKSFKNLMKPLFTFCF